MKTIKVLEKKSPTSCLLPENVEASWKQKNNNQKNSLHQTNVEQLCYGRYSTLTNQAVTSL